MIIAYHRPKTLDEALTLLAHPNRTPLGGGTLLAKLETDPVEAVDLQSLHLDSIEKQGNSLKISATSTSTPPSSSRSSVRRRLSSWRRVMPATTAFIGAPGS